MPVSSNFCVAKFLRQKYKRSPSVLYIIYTISHQLMVEITTQNTSTYTRKNYLQIIRTSCSFLLGSLHFFIFKTAPPPTTSNTHARDTSSNCRDKEPTPGTDEFITSVEGLQHIRPTNAFDFSPFRYT